MVFFGLYEFELFKICIAHSHLHAITIIIHYTDGMIDFKFL